jgi:hypothetical protein
MTTPPETGPTGAAKSPRAVRFGRLRFPVPRTKATRTTLGVGLIVLGLVPFIPPGSSAVALGLTYLSIDYPKLRRPRRKALVMSGRFLEQVQARWRAGANQSTID